MAYFSNGSDGAILDEQCAQCPLGDKPCVVAETHLFYNYKQIGNALAREIMNTLVTEEGTCRLKPMLAGMTPPEPEPVYDPMSPELREWAKKRGLRVREAL